MSIWLGKLQVDIIHAGRGHTKGDTIVWLPEERTLFSGDLVEYGATPYCGDAHYKDWPETLQKLRDLRAEALVPGRGDALVGEPAVEEGIAGTQQFLSDLYKAVSASAQVGRFAEGRLRQGDGRAAAALRQLGDLRALHAVRRVARLRRGQGPRPSAHLDGRARHRDVGGAGEGRLSSYDYRHYPYRRPAELDGPGQRRPVVIVGAGMAGPTLALSLAARGVPSVVLDEDDTVSLGSRSICQAKHSLEIWDRFGIAQRMVDKGITWEQGEVYLRDQPIYRFNLQPEPGHKFPAFVNLQQYYVEEFLYERCLAEPVIELRVRNKVVGVQQRNDGVTVEVETPDGRYTLEADWLVACDGVRSAVRHLLGLPYPGEVFHDQFLIADIRLKGDLPKERRFWFYPPFHPTNSVLLHRQADDVLRVDFQLGPRRRSRGGEEAGECRPPPAPDVRPRRALGARMDQRLHLHLPHDGALRARPDDLRRRCRARRLAVRRARRQCGAWPTPTISPGSWRWWWAARRRCRCSTATTASAAPPRARTS